MQLEALITLITDSNPNDWSATSSGPTFRDRLMQVSSGGQSWIEINSHHTIAVYKPDISISLGFGMAWKDKFDEPWANKFPDPSADGRYIDIYYYGSLVYRDVYVIVDGGRASLPMPKGRNDLVVAKGYHDLIRLINSVGGAVSQFDDYFKRAGLQVGQQDWPKI